MPIHPRPSRTRPGIIYDVVITDDASIICECRGYSRKVEIVYRTGVRVHAGSLCRHALQVATEQSIKPKQPRFHWVNLANGETFPVTERARSKDEHMLAYYHRGQLDPLEMAYDDRFPRETAAPDRDYAARMALMLATPPSLLTIAVTGDVPNRHWTRNQVRDAIQQAGATIKRGAVTADTSVLVSGANPADSKISRARDLLTPIISYAQLMALLNKPAPAT